MDGNKTISLEELARHDSVEECWIAIEGKVYNVSNWLDKHPGGHLPILSLAGRDATDGFQSFHPIHVNGMLSKFLVGDLEVTKTPAVVHDFRKLRKEFEAEGLFETNLWFYINQVIILACLLLLVFLGVMATSNIFVHMGSAVLLGFIWNMCSFIGHDSGHNGITHKRKTDIMLGLVFGDLMTGIGIGWWKRTHNIHHLVCNSLDYDPDIQHVPLLAVSSEYFKSLYSFYKFKEMTFDSIARNLVSYQHIYFYPLMAVARINLYIQTIGLLVCSEHNPVRLHELTCVGLFFSWYSSLVFALPSTVEKIGFLLLSMATSGILHVQICTSHFPMATFVGRPENHGFVQTQFDGTLDIECPTWLDWFWGGLQFQIEHHLFPRLPRHNLRQISQRVQKFADKHNLGYTKVSFWRANELIVKNLRTAAMEARKLSKPEHCLKDSILWDGLNAKG